MKICRFKTADQKIHAGLLTDDGHVLDLAAAGITELTTVLENADPLALVRSAAAKNLPRHAVSSVTLLTPVERQEVWAAGVTYLRSKTARMEESDFSATAYDRVYAAARPEIFFKSVAEKVVGPGENVGIRADAKWNVPEPELALVINSKGNIVGYTVGNDMSSRDIEGENLLYLPQAKVYDRACAVGPCIMLGTSEADVRQWKIKIAIKRAGKTEFSGETSPSQLIRGFKDLAGYLFRSQTFANGAVLLTGTGVVPNDSFTLQAGDQIDIEISGVGLLSNTVAVV
jgi:2-dehydro-3-deoxy-D-arabinonate dehydratase